MTPNDAALYTNSTLALNAVGDEQFIAVPTGIGVFKLMTAKQSPEIYQPNGGNALYVFKLPD